MTKKPRSKRYLSYMLRLWPTEDQGQQIWRATLESPGTRERWGFSSLKALFAFLTAQTQTSEDEGMDVPTTNKGEYDED